MRLLIVDDDDRLRRAVNRLALKTGYQVTEADSVEAAKAVIESVAPPDIIVCDVMMPGQTGADLHRWLQAHHPRHAGLFIWMTGGIPVPEVREYVERSGLPILEKPFPGTHLQFALDSMEHKLGA